MSRSWKPHSRSRSGYTRGHGRGGHRDRDAKTSMELIASVSRSSGLEKDGDTLKDFKIQDDYLHFILKKVAQLSPLGNAERTDKRRNEEENVLILFRKLREGISSSNRQDAFTLNVYETSLFMAAIFDSQKQLNSIVPQLPSLHDSVSITAHLISLVHYLTDQYPRQGVFQQHLDLLPSSFLPRDSEARKWITSVSTSLRTHNYVKFAELTHPDAFLHFVVGEADPSSSVNYSAARLALQAVVDSLRRRSRDDTWSILRASYREWSCQDGCDWTRTWLEKCLVLRSVSPRGQNMTAEQWLEGHAKDGHVRPKEGIEGRWIVCKPR
ncbi:hypothetical protein BDN71DRAFT_1497854 [Pleurotus eryngii]|uniref:Uncharacterized protein n=1 Tax=Pleurotus eryngii TaxID=5323 RepID=A0A9P5ZSX6_PLEER|nr:hypothetical protein BDN71DRAFT_1497854 [Pleurotus eryngii]